jgi:hypothetical protein
LNDLLFNEAIAVCYRGGTMYMASAISRTTLQICLKIGIDITRIKEIIKEKHLTIAWLS